MIQRLADYVADFMAAHDITHCFTVVGGGAMHLNDAFGHHPQIKSTYHHHEQGAAIAAESYARQLEKPALLCVTTGPGGTNALTGVVGAWLDSLPMMVVSGQVRYDTTARYTMKHTGCDQLRAVGDQEFDITKAASSMCKYAEMLEDPMQIRYMLEKAYHLATTGRPGPSWVDIPVNFQGMKIDVDLLQGYDPSEDDAKLPVPVEQEMVEQIIAMIEAAKRPVIYAGSGIRHAHAFDTFRKVIEKLGVPVVTYWNAIDLIEDNHPLYVGRGGNMGDRAGNLAVQNADLVLAIGTRLSIRQVGYNYTSWARCAKVIMVDIDRAEMCKHTLHVDMPVWADAKDFLDKVDAAVPEGRLVSGNEKWRAQCETWKHTYPVVTKEQKTEKNDGTANVYAAIRTISEIQPEGGLTSVSNGACCVAGHQAWIIKKGTRFMNNSAIASMGYGLPAAIGQCIAGGSKDTVCMEGDGSIMMNLQELQTIVTNNLPIKLFLINNQGYHSIRITQNNLFSEHCKIGIGPESKDLSFPSFEKIAAAFGMPYFAAHSNAEVENAAKRMFATPGFAFCEIFTDTKQVWEPKSSARRLPDGTLVSPPLEDLAPFLPREELKKQMYIPMMEE